MTNTALNFLFYIICFLLYFIPACSLFLCFAWNSKNNKPGILLPAGVNFLLSSITVFVLFIVIALGGHGLNAIFLALPVVLLTLLMMLPFVIIGLYVFRYFIMLLLKNLRANSGSHQNDTKQLIFYLVTLVTYILMATIIYFHLL